MKFRATNYLHLAAQSVLFFFPAVLVGIAIHEVGHGIGALLSGAHFNGLHITFFNGVAYTSGLETSKQHLLTFAYGSTCASLIGLVICLGILPKLTRWGFTFFWSYLGFISLIDLPRNMFYSGLGNGDFRVVSYRLGIPLVITMVVGAVGMAFVVYFYARAFGRPLAKYFSFDTYWQRLSVFLVCFTLPMFFTAVGVAIQFTAHNHLSGIGVVSVIMSLGTVLSALMALTRVRSSLPLFPIPKVPSIVGIGVFGLALSVWLGLFGTGQRPRGIIWSAPWDQEVKNWNLLLSVRSDLTIKADFLMRPTDLEIIWQKQRLATPHWEPYDMLAHTNLPRLMSAIDWRLVERVHDDTVLYSWLGLKDRGARRISFSGVQWKDSTHQTMNKSGIVLDFESLILRDRFYRLEVHIDTTLIERAYGLMPTDSPGPILDEPNTLVFASQTLQTVKTIHLDITRK